MIDVVRLLKNQESFEIQQAARGEPQAPHLPRRLLQHPGQRHPPAAKSCEGRAQGRHGRDDPARRPRRLPRSTSTACRSGRARRRAWSAAAASITRTWDSPSRSRAAGPSTTQPSKVVGYTPQKDAFLELYTMAVPPECRRPREFLVRNAAMGRRCRQRRALQVERPAGLHRDRRAKCPCPGATAARRDSPSST